MGARSAWWSSGRGLDKRKSLLPYVIDGRIKGTWTALRHTTALHAQAYRRATVLETLRAMDVLGALADGNVTFRWRDSAHGNKKRIMTLAVEEFLRRFLLHLLPPGFVRIRNFGFLANRNRAALLPLCFQLLSGLEKMPASVASPSTDQSHSLWNCPVCGGTMRVVERLSAAQLLLRSPPQPDRCEA